ncbi:MAG: magnesium transporter [Alphaproteobacteria bacterium]|nr:MAG: magnesium transporter [Alphaproteobacteria bacterium]
MNFLPIRSHNNAYKVQYLTSLIIANLNKSNTFTIKNIFAHLHASESAGIIHFLSASQREKLVNMLGDDFDPYILACLDDDVREEIIESWANEKLGHALSSIDESDALEILSELHPEQRKAILNTIKSGKIILEEGLNYPEKSAGRLMHYQIVALPEQWTIEKTISFLSKAKHLPENFYSIFIVDTQNKPTGSIKLQNIYRHNKSKLLLDCMEPILFELGTNTDQEELALLFKQYSSMNAPVVDKNGKIVGAIDANTVIEIIFRESEEDLLHMAGVEETGFHAHVIETARSRFKWLFISSCTSLLSVTVIGMFEQVLSANKRLAMVMPITAAMGGNSGMQVVAIMVRALSNKQISYINMWRVLRKEFLVGVHNGLIFAILFWTVSYFFISKQIAFIFACSVMLNIIWAGLIGMLLPMLLNRFGMDPALSTSSFLTACTDMMGYTLLLLISSYFLF